jgi:hypothetical protein
MSAKGIASILATLLVALFGLVFNENLKELFKTWGWNAVFVNYWQRWRSKLHLANLRGLWWLWLCSGLLVGGGGVGIALGLWLSPVVLGPPQQVENAQLKTLVKALETEAQSNAQDAAKWRFAYYLRYAPRAENNDLLTCKFMLVLSPGDAAWNLWVILQPMLELAHWTSYPGPNLSRPETPFQGVTIISGENKDASACGAALGKSGLTPVSWRDESLGSGSLA